ncbi:MAG: Ig-like domain-containing protein [Bacilli bacterium]|nr:Ig-like domain-containing protein [Bacilli bacterium]
MKKSLIAITAVLALSMMMGCNQHGNPSSSTNPNQSSSSDGGASSSQEQTVKVTSVTVTPGRSKIYLSQGDTVQLTAIVAPNNATNPTVKWSSSNTELATVDNNGLVKCLAKGTVRITATSDDDATIKDIATIEILQYESQDDTLSALNQPLFYESYKRNTQDLDDVENINGATELLATKYFKNVEGKKDNYRVGADNAFKLNVTGKVTDDAGGDTVVSDPHVLVSIAKWDKTQSKYVDLAGQDLAAYASIAADNKSVDFTDAAVDSLFKITIAADKSYYAAVGDGYSPVVLEVEVTKGINAYDKYDLSVFDNRNSDWATIRANNNKSEVVTEGIVLHSDITIDNSDIPQSLKYSEAEVNEYISKFSTDFADWCAKKEVTTAQGKDLLIGSVKDEVDIFRRYTLPNQENFNLEGNYFKINCSGIKQVYAFNGSIESGKVADQYSPDDPSKGCDGSHSQLFSINVDVGESDGYVPGGAVNFKNVTIIGNGDLSDDDKYMGGLITFKFNSITFTASNVLTSKSFTTFMPQLVRYSFASGATTSMLIDRSKCYDSYNSMIYVWGNENNIVTNSVMKRAGGAIALLDEVNAADRSSETHGTPKVDCFNVDLDNPVTGLEPWFVAHKATALVQMMEIFGDPTSGRWIGRNAALHGDHKNILTLDATGQPYINLIAVDIDGRDPLSNSLDKGSMLKGHFNIYNDKELTTLVGGMDMAKLAAADPTLSQEQFVGQVLVASQQGNYLPTYRLLAASQGAQGIITETLTGHAMLSDAPELDGDGNINPSTGFRNGVIADYNNPVTMSGMVPSLPKQQLTEDIALTPIPLYAGNSGTDDEVAGADYMSGRLTSTLNGLASGTYMSIYLQPSASTEYIGAFIKMQKLEMGN